MSTNEDRQYIDDRVRTKGVPHVRSCRCQQCRDRQEAIDAKARKQRPIPNSTAPGYTDPLRRFVQRNSYDTARDEEKYNGYAYILLDAIGAAEMPGWMLGPQRKALVTAIYKLRNKHNLDYVVLDRFYGQKQTEKQIATEMELTHYRVHDALRFCVGYLHGCLETDGEHARYRGVTPDMLYEGYVDEELDRLLSPDTEPGREECG